MAISIWFKYPGKPPERIDSAETARDAAYLLQEYRMAYGPQYASAIWAGPRNARNYNGTEKKEDDHLRMR